MVEQTVVMDDLELLLDLLPQTLKEAVDRSKTSELLEIVMDLGRLPEARYRSGFAFLTSTPITREDLNHVARRIGSFGSDHRAGIERTLHRISAMVNRKGDVIGLTCRVGRAIFGTLDLIRDFIENDKSTLILGRPGVGKTTMLREIARVLADERGKRVMIVDTSNEIAGDGDIPHPAIGHSRRMQVPSPDKQAEVMIEAVENHMPEVIVIDEIGTEAEAQAARTIAERGVRLIGTAHGNTLENLVLNPTLSDLIGGIHTVTLSDEEARRRGSQKTVLERKAPPTFDVVVELRTKDEMVIHGDVAAIIDGYLRGDQPSPEIRRRESDGSTTVVQKAHIPEAKGHARMGQGDDYQPARYGRERWKGEDQRGEGRHDRRESLARDNEWRPRTNYRETEDTPSLDTTSGATGSTKPGHRVVKVYPYGISRNYLERAIIDSRAQVELVKDIADADTVLTHKGQLRKLPGWIREAERSGIKLYVVRSNTQTQISALIDELAGGTGSAKEVLTEAEQAAKRVLQGDEPVELSPTSPSFRRLQHQLAERYGLKSTSVGFEPYRRVIIYRR